MTPQMQNVDPRTLLGSLTRCVLGTYLDGELTDAQKIPNPPLHLSLDPTPAYVQPFGPSFFLSTYEQLVNAQYTADYYTYKNAQILIGIYSKYAKFYLDQQLQFVANAAGFAVEYMGVIYTPLTAEKKK